MLVQKRMLITIGLLGGLTLAAAGAIAVPSVLAIRELKTKIAEEQEKLDTRYALRRYIRDSVTNVSETKRRIGALSTGALQEGKELDFITALESASAASGVEQEIMLETANQKEISAWEREIPLKLKITGQYDRVIRHLRAVERLPYFVLVETIAFTNPRASAGAGKDGDVETNVAAIVYWQSGDAPDFVRDHADEIPLSTD